MFGTVTRKLLPLRPQMYGNVDAWDFQRCIFRRQPLSFSVSKVLCLRRSYASFQTDDDTENGTQSEQSTEASSIVARRMYERQINSSDVENKPHLFQTTDELRNKLEHLSRQMNSGEISKQVEHLNKNIYKKGDHSHYVEDLILKEDILTQPTPSSLLGSEDQSVPASQIPCVGCGGMLQCQNRVMPGFLPSEKFKLMTDKELKTAVCQRCFFIQHHDTYFSVSASPDSYASMISKIKDTKSVVVMVVDVMDIAGTIIPDLMDNIGHKHPIIVVGNKADLLAPDTPDYLVNTRNEIRQACYKAGYSNIRKVVFVSAKTGFGIERLIGLLFSYYKQRVDVFIVGTANAGKSSLFNTLLASDYCKHSARDLIQRATVSVWPGTTLSFLKFPIMRPASRTVALRRQRLKQEQAIRKEMNKLKNERKEARERQWELKADVNKTDVRSAMQKEDDAKGDAWGQEIVGYEGGEEGVKLPSSLPEPSSFEAENYSDSYWMYDTPGVINPNQIMNMLEPNELSVLSPVNMIVPRCVLLHPGRTVFVSGLARLDYVKGDQPMMATFHCSSAIPLEVILTEEANEFYMKHAGTSRLGIPHGDKERLDKIPSLSMREFDFVGKHDTLAVADVQLSSVGWVSIAPKEGCQATVHAFTPAGNGLAVRSPSLAANYTHFRGKRISRTPFFRTKPQGSAMIGKTLVVDRKE